MAKPLTYLVANHVISVCIAAVRTLSQHTQDKAVPVYCEVELHW